MFKPNIDGMTSSVRIKNKVQTNTYGAPKTALVDASDPVAFCNWKSKGGTEVIVGGTLTVEDTAEVVMYYRDDITTRDVLLLEGDATKAYEVIALEDIEMRHLYLMLKVRRVVLS
jgi:hypothetical protein